MKLNNFPHNATCPLCGGSIKDDTVTRTIDLKPGTLIVNDVPAGVCDLCGEQWYMGDISEKLDRMVSESKSRGVQLEIISYSTVRIGETA